MPPGSTLYPRIRDFLRDAEMHEAQQWNCLAKARPIGMLERRTRQDRTTGMTPKFNAETVQPPLSVCVVQGYSLAHFLDVLWWMKLIAFDESQLQRIGQILRECGFATPCDSHDDDPQTLPTMIG